MELLIYDSQGKLIQQTPIEWAGEKVVVNIQQEAKGIYNAVLQNDNMRFTGKIVFE